jgi:hypothetical protein
MKILAGLLRFLGFSTATEYVNRDLGVRLKFPEGWKENMRASPGRNSAPLLSTLTRITDRNSELSFTVKKSVNPDLGKVQGQIFILIFLYAEAVLKEKNCWMSINKPISGMLRKCDTQLSRCISGEVDVSELGIAVHKENSR